MTRKGQWRGGRIRGGETQMGLPLLFIVSSESYVSEDGYIELQQLRIIRIDSQYPRVLLLFVFILNVCLSYVSLDNKSNKILEGIDESS